ncbi:MAG: HlyD family efflux transporter periplasmic adaptor subunit [Thermoguttaceae bacterium]|jgi:membrane fusion protein (multidrug efflux system)
MPSTFSRTLRFLDSDRRSRRLGGLLVFVLLAGWIAWLVLARVTVYEVSTSSRLEVKASAHTVSTVVAGKIAETHLHLGSKVATGDVLVVLDSEAERRAIEQKHENCTAFRARHEALDHEIRAEKQGLRAKTEARGAAIKEAEALIPAAEAKADAAKKVLARAAQLITVHAISDEEKEKVSTEAQDTQAKLAAMKLSVPRMEHERTAEESAGNAHLAELELKAAELDGEAAVEEAAIRRLQHEIELHNIRAPVAGRIEEVVELHVGAVVRAGDKLGTIVPSGEPRAVALFPAAAIGRIRPGQTARLRLEGFPWTQYGLLRGMVSEVGSEADGGLVRVELAIDDDRDSPIPVQHGLPGSVEIAVEKVSPAVLVLRAAGHFLAAKHRDQETSSAVP